MQLFLSTYVNKVDRKGRVSVPAHWRAHLANQPFQGAVVFPSFAEDCLEGMGTDHLAALVEGINEFDQFSDEQSDLADAIFAESRQLPFDTEGRIVLPEDFLDYARITTHAAFIGRGQTFQIWEPAAAEEKIRAARTRLREKKLTLRIPRPNRGDTA